MDVLGERLLDRLGAVLGLGDDLEVGLRVEHLPQAGADDRVVVGDEDARDERDRHQRSSSAGTSSRTSTPPSRPGLIASAPPTSIARSRMPRRPPCPFGGPRPAMPRPSSATRSDDAVAAALERDLDARRAGVPRDVRQALLRDAVDRELGLGRERRQVGGEAALDRDAALVGELARELGQRADEAEVLEHLRPQLLRDPAHLLERLPDRLLRLVDVAACSASRLGERVELEQHAGQHLADLVVQAARDPQPLGLLRRERAPAALAPLALEPVEHLVERRARARRPRPPPSAQALARAAAGRRCASARPAGRAARASAAAAAGSRPASATRPTTSIDRLDERDRRVDRDRASARAAASRRPAASR